MTDTPIASSTELAETKARERTFNVVLWLVATGFFMQTLDTTIVNTALPSMARSLGEAPVHMQSVIVAYSLTMAMMIPVSGYLADRLGTRRVFLAAIVIFTTGSFLCAQALTLWQLVVFRVVQGAGGAMLLPVGRLAVLRTFPRERYLPALSFIAVPGLVGPLVGPTLGGWLTEVASWKWVFLINVPVGALGALATALYMRGDPVSAEGRFDLKGYALLGIAMLSVNIALDGLAELGLDRTKVIGILLLSLVAFMAYAVHAKRSPAPLFPVQLFEIPTFRIGLLGNLFARIGSGAMPFLVPLLLQLSLGYTPFHAGLMMLPVAAAGMASKRLVVIAIRRYGYRAVLLSNTLLLGLTMSSFALVSKGEGGWLYVVQLAVFGGLNSMQFTAMNTVTLKDLGSAGASSGNSLFSLTQMLSMSLGVTIAGALFSGFDSWFGRVSGVDTLSAFHATFACLGVVTTSSAVIFARLAHDSNEVEKLGETVEEV